jgi:undecaprenyl-diphosphatase
LNQLASLFHSTVDALGSTHLTTEGLLIVYWWLWFREDRPTNRRTREILVASVFAAFFSVCLAIALAPFFPSYVRPIQTGAAAPLGFAPGDHSHPSFPSHHTMVAFVLVAGLLVSSRLIGMAAALYVLAFIGTPLVYLGAHYPVDILGGAVLGLAVGACFNVPLIRRVIAAPVVAFADRQSTILYPLAFFVTLQVATLFDDAGPFWHGLRVLLGRGGVVR